MLVVLFIITHTQKGYSFFQTFLILIHVLSSSPLRSRLTHTVCAGSEHALPVLNAETPRRNESHMLQQSLHRENIP
ncbi:hypothetical protein BJV77DRAFT_100806 [Russula vinacea]|nr:hypothetical protein BJV77DRAFT_100806 [Russula vinacea]